MMKIDVYITTTKTEEEFKDSIFYRTIRKVIDASTIKEINLSILEKNFLGLCAVYNKCIRQSEQADIVTFMHDDLEVHDVHFFEKLVAAHNHYDIVGAAGAASQDYTNMTIGPAWHLCMSNKNDGRGFVSHFLKTHINSTYFGPTPAETVFVDGLLVSFKRESVISKNIVFDEEFTFHMYDIVTCLEAKRNNLKIGVWPFFLLHHGLGEFANDKLWHKMKDRFIEKYTNYKNKV